MITHKEGECSCIPFFVCMDFHSTGLFFHIDITREQKGDKFMNQEMKNKVYSEIYSELKVDQDVTELGYPAERKNFDFSCKIKGIFFLFNLMAKTDSIRLRAEIDCSLDDGEMNERIDRIYDQTGYSGTAYDGKMVIHTLESMQGMSNEQAYQSVKEITGRFIQFLKENDNIPRTAMDALADPAGQEEQESGYAEILSPDPGPGTGMRQQENPHAQASYDGESARHTGEHSWDPAGLSDFFDTVSSVGKNKMDGDAPTDAAVTTGKPEMVSCVRQEEPYPAAQKKPKPKKELAQHKRERQPRYQQEVKKEPDIPYAVTGALSGQQKPPKKKTEGKLNDLYEELYSTFDDLQEQADYRQQTLDDYAKKLDEREQRVNSQLDAREKEMEQHEAEIRAAFDRTEQKLSARKEALEEEEKKLAFREKKLQADRAAVEKHRKDVEERAKYVERMKERVGAPDIQDLEAVASLKAQLDGLNEEKNTWAEKESMYQDKIIELSKDLQAKPDEAVSAQMEKQAKEALAKAHDLESKVESMEKAAAQKDSEIRGLNENLEEKQDRIQKMEADMGSLNEELKKSKEEAEAAREAAERNREPSEKEKMESLAKDFAGIGIQMEVTPGVEPILKGEKDGCLLFINLNADILYVEKAVRKGTRYQKTLESWNSSNIRETYFLTANKVSCKYTYEKNGAAKAAMSVLEKFGALR